MAPPLIQKSLFNVKKMKQNNLEQLINENYSVQFHNFDNIIIKQSIDYTQ